MKRPTDRRTVLITAGAVAVAAATAPVVAQSSDVRGAVTFEAGGAIPKGQIEIYVEDPAIQDKALRRTAKTVIASDGGSKAISFSLSAPTRTGSSSKLKVVARLERADGWLIARGSSRLEAGTPVSITLNTVIY